LEDGNFTPTFRVDWDNPPTLEGTYVTDMQYDALNRITQLVYPKDVDDERKVLLPTYNKAGALESVELDSDKYVTHIAYNAKGQRILIAYANTVMTRYAYDNQTFRLMRQRSETYTQTGYSFESDGSVKQDTAYAYDLHGNIIETTDKTTGCGIGATDTLSRDFDYDALYRLLQATGRENTPTITSIWDDSYRSADNNVTTGYTQNYQYDKMGNIQQLQHVGYSSFTRNFTYFSNTNKLQNIQVGITGFPFTYDNNGNQITETSRRLFQWDYADRLRSYKNQSGTSEPTQHAHYLYDAGGVRVKKLVRVQGGSYTSTVYIDGLFEFKTNGTDEQNTLHVMDDQSRIATVRLGDDFGDTTPDIKYNLEDHLGSSTLQLEDNGANINSEEYYPFGETSFGSYAKKRYKYCGKERDEESGLYYYGARYYNAWTGRFVSIDPLAAEYPQLTPYNYAGNKPITHKDIDGLQSSEDETLGSNQPNEPSGLDPSTPWSTPTGLFRGITYDIGSATFDVKVHIVSKVSIESEANNIGILLENNSGPKEQSTIDSYLDATQNQFAETMNLHDKNRNIRYSGELEFDKNNKSNYNTSLSITDAPKVEKQPGMFSVAGLHYGGSGYASAEVTEFKNGVSRLIDRKDFAETAVHELLHVGLVEHPTDMENTAVDAQLFQDASIGVGFFTGPGVNPEAIFTNIMMYSFQSVNGVIIGDYRQENSLPGDKITADQALILTKAIGLFFKYAN